MSSSRDGEVEKQLQAKGLNAPRITPEMVDAAIKNASYTVFSDTQLTVCCITLQNGFTVTGESACASPENFDKTIGEEISFRNARDKIWAFEGYLLKQKLHTQVVDPIQSIFDYNKARGFLESGYDAKRECAYPIEEALEGFDLNSFDDHDLPFNSEGAGAKELSRVLINIAANSGNENISEVDSLDKHLDTIVFAFGSIFKLGLSPAQAMEALSIVMEANMTKSLEKDSMGKNIKGDTFVPPEEKLTKFFK